MGGRNSGNTLGNTLALRVAAAYALFGALWIVTSDSLVEVAAPTMHARALVQTVKGLTYVALSTALIYFVAARGARALTRERSWFGLLFEKSPDPMFVLDAGGHVVAVNDAAVARFGYTAAELRSRTPLDLAPPDEHAALAPQLEALRTARAHIEARLVTKAGDVVDVDIVSDLFAADGQTNVVLISRDVTAQRRAAAALVESEARFRAVVESTPEALVVEADGGVVWTNPACAGLLGSGVPRRGQPLSRHLAAGSQPLPDEVADGLGRGRVTLVDADGRDVPVEVTVGPMRFDGQRARLLVIRDLRASRDAGREREHLVSALEQTADAIFITAPNGAIRYVNPAFETITGYATDEVLGATPRILQSGAHEPSFYAELWETLASGKLWRGTLINQRKDGTPFTVDATISPVRDERGVIVSYIAVERDVTRERALAAQVQQADKMTAIGRLAGGVAHDFNNMLTVILAVSELAQWSTDGETKADLVTIHDAALRSAAITRQLLTFARRERAAPRVIDLGVSITESITLLRRLVDDGIRVEWRAPHTRHPVLLDPVQLDQVLTNLIVNARDAIGSVGSIEISVRDVRDDDPLCQRRPALAGSYVALAVRDTGHGMSEAVRARIFEPFFTTKTEGAGTGLGLATVFGIVEQNNGIIDVESAPGAGSTFTVAFPRHDGLSRPAAADDAAGDDEGRATVLVVDDEVALVAVCRRILSRLGYDVLTAGSPSEAIELARAHAGTIHLVLSDVVMPEMSGQELCAELRRARPELRCLLMSGYPARNGDSALAPLPLLSKPFRAESLADAVRRALRGVDVSASPRT